MLRQLGIRDFVIVDQLDLEFDAGFTVLTGETGAGKSILIDALSLVLGERSDAELVREGCTRAEISAEFDIRALPDLTRWLEINDLAGEPGVCLLRRVLEAGGRSRAYLNGRPSTLAQVKELGERLVDIHGQHEHQSLVRSGAQRELLDAFGGSLPLARNVEQAWRRWQDLKRRRMEWESNAEALAAERERLQWQVQDLTQLAFSAAEWGELQADHRRLAHAASLIETVESALELLSESEAAALTTLNGVVSRLQAAQEFDADLKDVLDMLEPARIQVQEAAYSLRHYRQRLDLDPARLRDVEQRLDAVHSTARKYRSTPDELPQLLTRAESRLQELGGTAGAQALLKEESEAGEAYLSLARQLTEQRGRAARELAAKVTDSMQKLAMAGGRFEIGLEALSEGGAHGLERIEFQVAPHPGALARPLAKVASGGELSRLSLAVQTVTSEVARVPVLIFDEVDAGIGGRVADIVGRMLKQLGRRHQVMCITHLPQVAAAADQQWRVAKRQVAGGALSSVTPLASGDRVDEIARMLGGLKITDTTRRHAAELLGKT